jgi:hypothetical protein
MLHKSVKIDRIKYPTTTFAVLLISFCITVMTFLPLGVHTFQTLSYGLHTVFKLLRLALYYGFTFFQHT